MRRARRYIAVLVLAIVAALIAIPSRGYASETGKTSIENATVNISGLSSSTYDGVARKPTVTSVTLNNVVLHEGADYEVTYGENIHPDQDTNVYITGIGDYEGTITRSAAISKRDIKSVSISGQFSYPFTGFPIKPLHDGTIKLTYRCADGSIQELKLNEDYWVTYHTGTTSSTSSTDKPLRATTYTMRITTSYGNKYSRDFQGYVEKQFTITPVDLNDVYVPEKTVINNGRPIIYAGGYVNVRPTPDVQITISSGQTYKLSTSFNNNPGEFETLGYSGDRDNVGVFYAVVKGNSANGSITGELRIPVTIEPYDVTADDSKLFVFLNSRKLDYTGGAQQAGISDVTLGKFGNRKMIQGEDYDLTYENNVNAGSGDNGPQAVLTFKGNYTGVVKEPFTINPMNFNIGNMTVTAPDQTYTGEELTPDLSATLKYWRQGSAKIVTLKQGVDFTATYSDNVEVGTATVEINGIGNFAGTASGSFKITAPEQLWKRLAGKNALATMREIVREGFAGKGGTVVIATNASFKDALSAAALAGKHGAPILMTPTDVLSAVTASEIRRLAPEKAYIVGGELAVSKAVEDAVKALVPTVERVAGASASSTSVEVAKKVGRSATAIVATSADFADALSIAPWAYANRAPIILTNGKGQLTQAGLSRIKSMGAKRVVIVGGTIAVNQESEDMLAAAGLEVVRLAGATAVRTSAAVAAWELDEGFSLAHVACATRTSYKDALAGSALMGQLKGPIVLVNGTNYSAVRDTLKGKASQLAQGYFLGGEAVISADTAARIEAIK